MVGHTLTVYVEGVNKAGGDIGILLFNSERGWPETNSAAYRKMEVPTHPGTVVFKIENLPAGTYALSLAHDVNRNRKLDRNWFGKPTEQWGLSNNPHAYLKPPPFSKSQFSFTQDSEIHIRMQ